MELEHAHVLVVDDNTQVRTLIATALGDLVAGCRGAADAIAGLGLWLATRPQLVLVDFEMPDVNGAAFIRILRAQEAVLGLRTAVVMITAHGDRDHVMAARDAGSDGLIIKPLNAELIVSRAAQALSDLSLRARAEAAYV